MYLFFFRFWFLDLHRKVRPEPRVVGVAAKLHVLQTHGRQEPSCPVLGVSSPWITPVPTSFVSCFLTPLTFADLEGSWQPTSSSQSDAPVIPVFMPEGGDSGGRAEPASPASLLRGGVARPTDKEQLRLPSPGRPVPDPFILLSFS